ncbi:DoxX family protein [Halolamina sediminis]|uniref:DoxX family protein n=1 Tax=Halolamina sediminis TaxID=1480675 RepID=UPI0006B62773|nr:MauE/DoxX family redox-associated membrane protein [Halolamina sediminis]
MSDSDSGRTLRTVMGLLYVVAGVSHFLAPRAFERVVPPQFPRPRALVHLSGIAEVVLGAGVLFERSRRVSAWGIVALLIAVFPANVYTVTDDVAPELVPDRFDDAVRAAAVLRLPFQAVLVAWAWLYTRPEQDD